MKQTPSILCQMCGKRFRPIVLTRAKFCSRACGQRYRRKDKIFQKWVAMEKEKAQSIQAIAV